ncbi:MAG: bacteriohopanetetrol glucosamine biosynthesis glycosyltransferase HpnI, partial [Candidatus Elarobacter sp.]
RGSRRSRSVTSPACMRARLRKAAAIATCGATLGSLAYIAFALWRVIAFGRRPIAEPNALGDGYAPSVTVLKPLRGHEPALAANLASFCAQDYERYDVLFGARDADDAALAVAREVVAAFPLRARALSAQAETPSHANPKVDTLAALLPHAHGELLLISDGDMRVERGYLRALSAAFADPAVGAVTCLYRGAPAGDDVASALGAQANHEHFAPSALVAHALLPQRLCFGATMAVRRSVFDAIGGLDALGPFLADDARLGTLVAERGLRVVLSRYVVENIVAERGLAALWRHELRWARTHRTLEPFGYAGLFLTYPIPLALLHLGCARRRGRALALLGAALALRFALGVSARRVFGARSRSRPWLVPLRDLLGLAVWSASFFSREVRWRDDRFTVRRDGRLIAREP